MFFFYEKFIFPHCQHCSCHYYIIIIYSLCNFSGIHDYGMSMVDNKVFNRICIFKL